MSGIKAWHDLNRAPWLGENRWVELARRTANKEGTAFKCDQRGPVTIEHMLALRAALNLNDPFNAAVWSLTTAAFWGYRRLGELTIPSLNKFDPKYHVSRAALHRHITPSPSTSATTIPLPWTKSTWTTASALRRSCRIIYGSTHTFPPTPLFAFSSPTRRWSPLMKDWFMGHCKPIWSAAMLLVVFTHSFHIGGSTELLLASVPCEIVAALRGWTSLVFLLYWWKIEHIVPLNIGKAYDKKRLDETSNSSPPPPRYLRHLTPTRTISLLTAPQCMELFSAWCVLPIVFSSQLQQLPKGRQSRQSQRLFPHTSEFIVQVPTWHWIPGPTLTHELRRPLAYPGEQEAWGQLMDCSSAMLNRYLEEWTVLTEGAKNQDFNVTDGSLFTWRQFWLAEMFGPEWENPVQDGSFSIVEWAKRPQVRTAWVQLAGSGERPLPTKICKKSTMSSNFKLEARRFGFFGTVRSSDSFAQVIQDFANLR
ncbi:hypothetical protein DFH07DRAFT_1003728 [Mycena maculata]|uniref:Uncharacterized protein n=1 Tax=Mycena maculata TaxID=230809 RepID=A0AAD7HN01_9AGAR|nr:hypothetical protein DFH07DRAFT_1003728 [Mycena maculata]